jgi:vancomycin resistance protein YoaR
VYVDDLPRTHDARFLVLFLLMFVGALGAVYGVGYLAAGDKVPARTTVAGVSVGSMSRHEARDVLVQAFGARLLEPMTVTVAGRSVRLTPETAGMSFDVEATLDEAMGGTDWNPQHMLKVVEGGGAVDPIFRAESKALASALAPLAARVEQDAIGTTVGIRAGKPVVHAGHPGRRLDVSSAAESFVAALRDHEATVTLRLSSVAPVVDRATATAFVNNTLGPALSRPVVVSVGGEALTVTPVQFGPALRVAPSDGQFRLGIVSGVLYGRTRTLLSSVPGRPVDARVVFRNGKPVVVPGHRGTQVDQEAWAKAVFSAATRNRTRRATASVTTVDPGLTTSDAKALGITTQIGAASGTAAARLAGAWSLAAHNLDATVVLPGATFSYAHVVGPASASTVLTALGAATQAAAERAHMTLTRWPAVSPVGHDLGFRNSSDHPVYIHTWVVPRGPGLTAVFVQFWGTASP